jgi:thymidylate synthase
MISETAPLTTVEGIRVRFKRMWQEAHWSMRGVKEDEMLEICHASFVVDEPRIFGNPTPGYERRELEWYISRDRNVMSLEPPIPAIWSTIAGSYGKVNSNYGWCVFSKDNGDQFNCAVGELIDEPESRQAVMIYTRPQIREEVRKYSKNAADPQDFICTNTAQLLIRNNQLHYVVQMRSNDAVFGFKNDVLWHNYVWARAMSVLQAAYPDLEYGKMLWNAASLHVYPRHHQLVKEYANNDS